MFSAAGSMPTTLGAHAAERLGDEAAAAADVEDAEALQRLGVLRVAAEAARRSASLIQASRIGLSRWSGAIGPVGVPPFRGERREAGDFGLVDGGGFGLVGRSQGLAMASG